jgi:hypothetical protein
MRIVALPLFQESRQLCKGRPIHVFALHVSHVKSRASLASVAPYTSSPCTRHVSRVAPALQPSPRTRLRPAHVHVKWGWDAVSVCLARTGKRRPHGMGEMAIGRRGRDRKACSRWAASKGRQTDRAGRHLLRGHQRPRGSPVGRHTRRQQRRRPVEPHDDAVLHVAPVGASHHDAAPRRHDRLADRLQLLQ